MKAAGITMGIKQEVQSKNINDVIAGNYQVSGWRNHPGFDPDDQWVWWHCYAPPAAGTPQPGVPAATDIAVPGPPSNGNNCDNPVNFGRFNDTVINKAFETGRSSADATPARPRTKSREQGVRQAVLERLGLVLDLDDSVPDNVHNILGPNLPTATSPDAVGPAPFPGSVERYGSLGTVAELDGEADREEEKGCAQ